MNQKVTMWFGGESEATIKSIRLSSAIKSNSESFIVRNDSSTAGRRWDCDVVNAI